MVSFQGNPRHLSILFRVAFQSPEMINFVVPVLETSFSPKILKLFLFVVIIWCIYINHIKDCMLYLEFSD